MEDNKKTLVLSIIGILVLVIAVVGVSFAMFSFSGTGTKQNVINTGTVTLDFTNVEGSSTNVITATNQYPLNDANGVALSKITSKADFNVHANFTASMTINYELGIVDYNKVGTISSDATAIPEASAKIILLDSTGAVVVGSKSGDNYTGVTVASLASTKGPKNLITSYYLTNGSFTTGDTSNKYTIYAYVDSAYELPVDTTKTTTDNDENGTVTRENTSTKATKTAEFSFKLTVKAAQA